jgi:putative ABC transport system permease protein
MRPALTLTGKLWEWSEPVLFNHYSLMFILLIIGFMLLLSIGLPLIKLQSLKFELTLAKKGKSKIETVGKRLLLSGQMIGVTVLMVVLFIMVKQLNYIQSLQLGYKTANRAYVNLPGDNNKQKAPYLLEQLKQMSFVQSASVSTGLVIQGLSGNSFTIPGKEDDYWISRFLLTDKNYHETMGMQLLSGQYFSAFDNNDNNIVIINQELTKMMNWDNPVGQEIISENMSKNSFRVVGVVEDFMHNAYVRKLPAIFYRIPQKSLSEYANYISLSLLPGTTAGQIGQIRSLLKKENDVVPMYLTFYDMEVAQFYSTERQLKSALMFFALLAIFLAVVGLAGVVLNEVQQRTKEIGIRKVNGATIAEVLAMLNKDFLRWVILSFIIAFPLAYFAVQLGLQSYAYKTEISWWIFALAGALALGIALLTVSWQSWKAATKNPVEALRYE